MRLHLVVVALTLVAAACSGAAGPQDPVRTTVAFTDPAREQFEWLVEAAQSGELGADALGVRFSSAFLQRVGDLGIIQGLVELELTTGEWEVVESEFGLFEGVAVLRNSDGDRVQMRLGTHSFPPYAIDDLQASRLSPEFEGGVSEEAVDERIQQLGHTAWGVFEVEGRSCVPLAGSGIDDPGPIASSFDLWVVAALAEAVEQGDASFTEMLAVDKSLRSTLDGQIGSADAGTEFPLSWYAEQMFRAKDNSAADHLIDRLGREAVERAMVNAGVATPELNEPFLTTREVFVLKFRALAGLADDYIALDAEGRRMYLEDTIAGVTLAEASADAPSWDVPVAISDIEWFASPADLCRSHAYLADLAERPGLDAVAMILDTGPGVPLDQEVWEAFQFDSGTEPGVSTASWYLVRGDGRAFVVAGIITDPDRLIDDGEAIALFQAVIELAAVA